MATSARTVRALQASMQPSAMYTLKPLPPHTARLCVTTIEILTCRAASSRRPGVLQPTVSFRLRGALLTASYIQLVPGATYFSYQDFSAPVRIQVISGVVHGRRLAWRNALPDSRRSLPRSCGFASAEHLLPYYIRIASTRAATRSSLWKLLAIPSHDGLEYRDALATISYLSSAI